MSGVEIVGLLLGGFPLLISAAEHYKEGFEPLVKWYRFRDDFIQFIDAVVTQKLLFDQTVERFLISANIPDEELQQFMKYPNYKQWHRTDLVDLLKTRLGPAYEVFMSTIERMQDLLLVLQKLLLVKSVRKNGVVDWEVEWASDGASRWNYQMKRICLSFSKKGNITVEELERHNKKLALLLESKDKLDTIKATKKDTKWANIFAGIKCHANSLYGILKSGFNCDCPNEHPTSLRLQRCEMGGRASEFNMSFTVLEDTPRLRILRKEMVISVRKQNQDYPVLKAPIKSEKDEYLSKLRQDFQPQETVPLRPNLSSSISNTSSASNRSGFRDFFMMSEEVKQGNSSIVTSSGSEIILEEKFSRKWFSSKSTKPKKSVRMDVALSCPVPIVAACVTPGLGSPAQGNSTKREEDNAINDLCKTICSCHSEKTYLGYLVDEETQQYELRCTSERAIEDDERHSISLERLLNNEEGLVLSRQQRYKLASILASSLLQLQTTPWIHNKLDKKNIFFLREGGNVVLDYPFVRQAFHSTKHTTPSSIDSTPNFSPRIVARNSLSNLGTLLLELCFGKPVEKCELRRYHLDSDGKPHERTNWSTARDWAETVCEEDPRLEHIINCCMFDILQQKPDWDSKAFVQAVYVSVVEPLDKLIEDWETT